MRREEGDASASWPARFPQAMGGWVAAVGTLALLGWLFDIAPLRGELPGLAAVRPNTAVFFLGGGLSLIFLAGRYASRRQRTVGMACAGIATAWAALHLIDYLAAAAGRNTFVFLNLAVRTGVPFEGSTTVWFVVLLGTLATAPFFLNTRRIHWFAELLIVTPLAITFLGLVTEVFRVTTDAAPAAKPASTFSTMFTFLLLELGLLIARRDRGWMAILLGDGLGGSLARRLLPIAVLIPFGMAWLKLLAEQAGLLNRDLGGTLYSLAIIVVQTVLIMWYAAVVNRADRERKEAEEFVRSLLGIGAKLNSTLDIDSLLNVLVQETIQLVDAEGGLSGLWTADGMVCRRYIRQDQSVAFDSDWPPGQGLAEWVAKHRVPCRTNEAHADPRIDGKLLARFGLRSALCTPILDSHGEVLGFFEVQTRKRAASRRAIKSVSWRWRNPPRAPSKMPSPITTFK